MSLRLIHFGMVMSQREDRYSFPENLHFGVCCYVDNAISILVESINIKRVGLVLQLTLFMLPHI